MQADKPTLLVVEDDELVRQTIIETLEELDVNIVGCENGEEGLKKAMILKPIVVLSDIMMPKMNGLEMLSELVNQGFEYPVVMLSAYSDHLKTVHALRLGAYDFLTKPFSAPLLINTIEEAIGYGKKIKEFNNYWNEVIAAKPELTEVQKQLNKFKREMAKMKFLNRKKVV